MEKKLNSKSGLSQIVTTLLLVLLSIVAIGVIWVFIQNLINQQIKSSESCFGNYDKIQINKRYTCYENLGGSYKLRFSLAIGDIDVDKIIVSVSSGSAIKSYEITNTAQIIPDLVMYSGTNPENIILPGKNSGLTYNATGFTSMIDSIQIAPRIGGNQCEVADSISQIANCNSLV